MKVLLINGSPNAKGCTYTALSEVANTLNKHNIETEFLQVGKKPISGCISCHSCQSTHKCVFTDVVNEIGPRLDEFDGIIVGSPTYWASPSGQVIGMLDRLFYAYESKMAGKVAAAVINNRRGGATAAFDVLNKYFTMTNMFVIGSQYWNQTHGFTPEDVKRDLEGMQTMRTLGQNMAYILKCMEAAKQVGIEKPVYEERVFTHFMNIETGH